MASKKDMRRLDLAIPYVDPPANKDDADMSGAMTSTMPMAAMFTRNRMIGWVSFVFSLQNWLGETPEQKRTASTPAYMSVFMSLMALVVVRLKFPPYPPCLVIGSDPFAEADEDTGETKQSQNYIHIRIQQRNGRKTLTTVQGLPKKFDQKKILKVIKKKFACNGTIVADSEMGEVIQLQGDQRKDVQEFLTDKKEGLELDAKTIKVHGF
ncbi:SUI1-domain-containing protein [Aspergillus novoparasiticus]|uniref:SUI1-domain-containing protein n=1 Tax=Aspergillus novoparasiticus TaxID=986946 RepID=A0A5N6EUR7_9EURO|nr:SUI1-domain-containing protein [Aspergillus novoparasiticus]